MRSIRIQTELFDPFQEEKKLREAFPDDGALVSFKGFVRGSSHKKQPLEKLYLEHYPVTTENEIERIIKLAEKRWTFSGCTVIHRIGELTVGEPIILVLVSSKHRSDAFHSVEFIMDYLKTEAPFWKKEFTVNGENHWVEAKQSDEIKKMRWSTSK